MADKFSVYIVYSKWSLKQIDTFLSDFGGCEYSRIVYEKNTEGKTSETNRTIVVISDKTYKILCDDGYGDTNDIKPKIRGFKIKQYVVRDRNLISETPTRKLFIPVPHELKTKHDIVLKTVNDKLKQMSELNIIDDLCWEINIPLKTRETGDVRNGCHITFTDNIDINKIAMTKILLDDSYWPKITTIDSLLKGELNNERKFFKCRWEKTLVTCPTQPTLL
jgi:hypothetical protein